jgi:hypothetical protein
MNEDEKKLREFSQKLESKRCKDDLLFYAEAMVRAQEALKKDYELEFAMRRQYGLSAEGYPGQAVQAAEQAQAGAGV